MPNPKAIPHSISPNSVNLNAEAMAGTSTTIVVKISETNTEPNKTQFGFFNVKIDCRRLRKFTEWKQPTILMVKNAIEIPCAEVIICHIPVSRYTPMK